MMPLLAVLLACARPVPEHLRVPSNDETADMPDVAVSDMASAVAGTIGKDPLSRAPTLLPTTLLREIDGTEPLRAFGQVVRDLERGDGRVDRSLQLLEDEWRGTVAVPLARGYRLRIAENRLTSEITPASADALLPMLSPVTRTTADTTSPRSAFAWLSSDLSVADVRRYADRWVMAGWLAGPTIHTEHVATLLASPQFDGLRVSPLGSILVARHSDGKAEDQGYAALLRATSLALQEAAADRDREQAAWADAKRAVAEELGTDNPVSELLRRSFDALRPGAADDRAAGAALLAHAALRWRGDCPDEPCAGLDRVEAMAASARWHPALRGPAAVWRVVSVKSALDTLEVGRETVLFPTAMAGLVDALVGTGAGPLESALLQKQRGDGTVWLGISRSVGADATVEWEGARLALGTHLANEARQARSMVDDAGLREMLTRIEERSIP